MWADWLGWPPTDGLVPLAPAVLGSSACSGGALRSGQCYAGLTGSGKLGNQALNGSGATPQPVAGEPRLLCMREAKQQTADSAGPSTEATFDPDTPSHRHGKHRQKGLIPATNSPQPPEAG